MGFTNKVLMKHILVVVIQGTVLQMEAFICVMNDYTYIHESHLHSSYINETSLTLIYGTSLLTIKMSNLNYLCKPIKRPSPYFVHASWNYIFHSISFSLLCTLKFLSFYS